MTSYNSLDGIPSTASGELYNDILRRTAHFGCCLDVDIRMLEEAHLKLEPQDAAASPVYLLLAQFAILDGGDELCVGLATQVFVHSGTQRHHASLLQVARHMVGLPDAVDAVEVGNDKATEAPGRRQTVGPLHHPREL